MTEAGRLLALDIGTARTGIAISDELRLTARPLETVPAAELKQRLAELTKEYGITRVIVGRPRSLDGSLGDQVTIVERLAEELQELPIELVYEDESATTPPSGDDAAAAHAILEGYLREHHG